jgi:mono/diheme cytochrome c family protein
MEHIGSELAERFPMGTRVVRAMAGILFVALAHPAAAAPPAAAIPAASQTAGQDGTGRTLYLRYCGACHGPRGRGDGPVAQSLGTPPTDLSQLATENGGKFPYEEVIDAIDGTDSVRTHGVSDMPVWGEVFRGPPGWPLEQQLTEAGKILLIADYLRLLQTTHAPVQ